MPVRPTPYLLCSAALMLALSGCTALTQRPDRVNGEVVLNGLESPDVEGVNATLLASAKEAEKVGDYRRAVQLYRQLVDADKANPTFLLGYSENLRRSGFTDEALKHYETLLALDKDSIEGKEGKALALMDKGEFDKAGDIFSSIMQKDNKRWRTLNGLGLLFVTKGMQEEGQAYFAEALKYSANNVSVLNNIGLSYALQGKTPDSIQALQKASELSSSEPLVQKQIDLNLALVHAINKDLPNARRIAGKYLSGPALNNNLGFYAHVANDDALAKSYLNMALSKSPQFYNRAWENLKQLEKQEKSQSLPSGGKSYKVQ